MLADNENKVKTLMWLFLIVTYSYILNVGIKIVNGFFSEF